MHARACARALTHTHTQPEQGLDLYCGKSTSGGSILSAAAAATLAVAAACAVLVMA